MARVASNLLIGDSNRLRVSGVNALGPLEKEIMDFAWAHGNLTVGDVHKAFRKEGKDLAYTTIMTTMSRLAQKGLLDVDKGGITYIYKPAMTVEEYNNSIINKVMDVLVDTNPSSVLSHLAKRLGGVTVGG